MDVAKSYVARRLPAVSFAPDPSTWILDHVVKPENPYCVPYLRAQGRREGGAGRLAVLFSRLAIPGLRMDRSVNVSLLLVV